MGESDLSAPFRINFVINVIGSDSLRKDFLKPCLQYGNGTDVREMLRNGADDSLIEEKMREAVFFKPDGHEFGRSGKGEEIETKKMSQIGG